MSKILVVFYSRADENYYGGTYRYTSVGNTEKVAKVIATLTGSDIFKIEQVIPYAQDYKTCTEQAKHDKENKIYPELARLPDDIARYDEIYLGYPNYWGTMPMAVYTLLHAFDWNGKTIHPFCTHEGSGLSATESEIKACAKGAKVTKGLAIVGSDVDGATSAIEKWVRSE